VEDSVVTFSFDVAFSTHDLLKAGVTEADWHRVVVAADDRDEAALLACQMVCCHDTATAIYDRI
jgi:hypothetical protein